LTRKAVTEKEETGDERGFDFAQCEVGAVGVSNFAWLCIGSISWIMAGNLYLTRHVDHDDDATAIEAAHRMNVLRRWVFLRFGRTNGSSTVTRCDETGRR